MVELCGGSIWEGYICTRPQANRLDPPSQRVSETVGTLAVLATFTGHRDKRKPFIGLLWYRNQRLGTLPLDLVGSIAHCFPSGWNGKVVSVDTR